MQWVMIFNGIAEALTGIILLFSPGFAAGLMLGTDVTGSGIVFAKLGGMALIGFGIACWLGPAGIGALIYGLIVGLYLVWLGITEVTAGPFLRPAVILHNALVVPLAMSVTKSRKSNACV